VALSPKRITGDGSSAISWMTSGHLQRDREEGEFERGLEGASLESLDSLSCELDAKQERLQRLYGEFPEASEQGRFIKRQIREVAGQAGSVKTSAMVRRNQRDAKR